MRENLDTSPVARCSASGCCSRSSRAAGKTRDAAKDLAGNLSTTSRSPANVIIKDTVAPLSAVYSVILAVNGKITGNAECGAFISAQRVPRRADLTERITSGTAYDIGVGLLSRGRVYDGRSTSPATFSAVVTTS